MAFGRLEREQGHPPMSDINMTPLIDVMLVLLILFMLTAPLMQSRLKLDLPATDAPAAPNEPGATLDVALAADGRFFLDDQFITAEALAAQARARADGRPDTEVHLRVDKAVRYERVAELMALLQQAGLSRIAFITETSAPQ
ncbi:biopolymer transporter ExbD [Aquabacterium fontiphilum]|uniref:ExbD/TolR family protein n=1 Tax=Aquabacterium fontiphilum TaxID=450365 RepID=UPI00137673DF|nr:biopolymer transporter ExbD [Aquabacterium fontiphilum]NBD21276.1 biopolymer transporter ExbD [Aquabacterium fontiphilum]